MSFKYSFLAAIMDCTDKLLPKQCLHFNNQFCKQLLIKRIESFIYGRLGYLQSYLNCISRNNQYPHIQHHMFYDDETDLIYQIQAKEYHF